MISATISMKKPRGAANTRGNDKTLYGGFRMNIVDEWINTEHLTQVSKKRSSGKKMRTKSVADFLCSCGRTKAIHFYAVKKGITVSCGCLSRKIAADKTRKHGMCNSSLYRTWSGIVQRTTNPNAPEFAHYGGRGIKAHDDWIKSFKAFMDYVNETLGPKPNGKYSIDRIDVNAGYYPGNLRWASDADQARNKRNNVWITIDGVTKVSADWAREPGTYNANSIRRRIAMGIPPAEAVFKRSVLS